MATDDILRQAFANVPAVQGQAFLGGMQEGNQVVDTAIKAQALLDARRQNMMMQQQKLSEMYLSKGSEMLGKAVDDKVPQRVKGNMVDAASNMFQRAGIGGFSDGFKQMFLDSPELQQKWATAQQSYLQQLSNPTDPSRAADLSKAIQEIIQSSYEDMPTVLRKLDEYNKNNTSVISSAVRQSAGLGKSAALDRYKEMLGNVNKASGFRGTTTPLQTPIPDPATGKPLLDANGNPIPFGSLQSKLALATQQGAATPSSEDNKIFEAGQTLFGQMQAKENDFNEKMKVIDAARAKTMDISAAGQTPEQKKDAAYLRSTKPNAQNIDDLYAKAQAVASGAVTTEDVTKRGRQLDDKAIQIKEDYTNNIRGMQKDQSQLFAKANMFLSKINTNTTLNEARTQLQSLAAEIDKNQRITESETGRMINKTYGQNIQQFLYSLTGDGGAKLNQQQVDILKKDIQETKAVSSTAQVNYQYQQWKNVQAYNPDLGSRMKSVMKTIESDISANSKRPATADISGLYGASAKALGNNANDQDKQNWVINNLIRLGFNPIAAENYFRGKGKK